MVDLNLQENTDVHSIDVRFLMGSIIPDWGSNS